LQRTAGTITSGPKFTASRHRPVHAYAVTNPPRTPISQKRRNRYPADAAAAAVPAARPEQLSGHLHLRRSARPSPGHATYRLRRRITWPARGR